MKKVSSTIGEVYLLNPKNQAILEGKSRYIHGIGAWGGGCLGLFITVWLIGWVGGCLAFANTGYQKYQRIEQNKILNVDGKIGQATIFDRRISSGDDNDTYFISYRFFIDRRAYEAEDEVSHYTYDDSPLETRILVRYLPENPNVSRFLATERTVLPTKHEVGFYGMAALFNVIGAVSLFIYVVTVFNGLNRSSKFRRMGRLMSGEIIWLEPQTDSDGDPAGVKLHYRVSERGLKGMFDVPQGYRYLNELAAGMPLAIWYADEKTHRPL